jgi:hypothetical protein
MGLNTSSFGDTDQARFKELRKRALQTLVHIEQSWLRDVRNVYITALLLKIIASGVRDGSTVNKYTMGISEDMMDQFRRLTEGQERRRRSLTLFLGAQDNIFPANEIKQSLKKASIGSIDIVVVARKSHSSLALRSSRPLVRRVVEVVRSGM